MAEVSGDERSDAPGGYPRHWEADVVLRDGSTTHVRPIRPEDADALQAFHVGQSETSTFLRFFAPLERLPDRDLDRFTHVDHRDRVALVAVTQDDAIIGVARYDRVAPDEAEVAFNIADAHHGRGLGSVLLEHLAAAARERGVRRFTADVLPQNGRMIAVFREAGYSPHQRLEDGVVTVTFDIDPTDRSLEVMMAREHTAESRSVQGLLSARSVLLLTSPAAAPGSWPDLLAARVLGDLVAGDVHDPREPEHRTGAVVEPAGDAGPVTVHVVGRGATPTTPTTPPTPPAGSGCGTGRTSPTCPVRWTSRCWRCRPPRRSSRCGSSADSVCAGSWCSPTGSPRPAPPGWRCSAPCSAPRTPPGCASSVPSRTGCWRTSPAACSTPR